MLFNGWVMNNISSDFTVRYLLSSKNAVQYLLNNISSVWYLLNSKKTVRYLLNSKIRYDMWYTFQYFSCLVADEIGFFIFFDRKVKKLHIYILRIVTPRIRYRYLSYLYTSIPLYLSYLYSPIPL